MRALVELSIRYGYGDRKTVAIPISDSITRELMQTVERSDDPLSLALASPALYGGRGDAFTTRHKTFKMRRDIAEEIAKKMVPALMQAFGGNDELDGYKIERMTEEEREYHRQRGRLK